MKNEILIIEDDKSIGKLVSLSLKAEDYKVTLVTNGETGLNLLFTNKMDLLLLDLGLPDIDGMEVLRKLREREKENNLTEMPVIIVSARDQEKDIVDALDCGANDYITKPFRPCELTARVRAALRKVKNQNGITSEDFVYKGLVFNFEKHSVFVDGEEVHLTPTEYKLLEVLITSRGKVLTHRYLAEQVWGHLAVEDFQFVRVTMANLRKKIEKCESGKYILTETGIGYRFRED